MESLKAKKSIPNIMNSNSNKTSFLTFILKEFLLLIQKTPLSHIQNTLAFKYSQKSYQKLYFSNRNLRNVKPQINSQYVR